MKSILLALPVVFQLIVTTSAWAEKALTVKKAPPAIETKVATCVGCHGEKGHSTVPAFPKLAGQHGRYLAKQLHSFKDSSRNAPMMAPLAANLNDEDIQVIADYYAAQKPLPNSAQEAASDAPDQLAALLDLGSDLYRNGDRKRAVSACIACHGPYGEGNKPAAFPMIKSQHAEYLIKTLNDFKTGTRTQDPENMMHMIAKKMSKEEIEAVSHYIATMK